MCVAYSEQSFVVSFLVNNNAAMFASHPRLRRTNPCKQVLVCIPQASSHAQFDATSSNVSTQDNVAFVMPRVGWGSVSQHVAVQPAKGHGKQIQIS